MSELFYQLGIDWRLLFAQGANFLILLFVLGFFVFRPLTRLMEERRRRIEDGLRGAEKAEKMLAAMEEEKKAKMAEAEKEAMRVISVSEEEAKKRYSAISAEAGVKAEHILKEAKEVAERKEKEALEDLAERSGGILREALAKAVSADPGDIDEKLIRGAAAFIKGKSV